MKERASKNIFGEVCEISREDWVREVTEASEDNPVVIHLFQDYVAECEAVDTAFRHLARDHGQVKVFFSLLGSNQLRQLRTGRTVYYQPYLFTKKGL